MNTQNKDDLAKAEAKQHKEQVSAQENQAPVENAEADEEKKEDGLSKNKKKFLEKQAKKDAEKLEKEKKKAELASQQHKDKPEKKKDNVVEEEILDPTLYFENRSKIIKQLKEDKAHYPYPHKFHVTHNVEQFIKEFDPLCVNKNEYFPKTVSVAGNLFFMLLTWKIKPNTNNLLQKYYKCFLGCNKTNHFLEARLSFYYTFLFCYYLVLIVF